MAEFKGTPGPWEDEGPNVDGERCIFGSNDYGVCVTIPAGNPDIRPDVSVANARLIASAPELLEACQAFLAYHDGVGDDDVKMMMDYAAAVDLARGAVAKALGAKLHPTGE